MRDFSCFGENGVQIADAASSSSGSVTTSSGVFVKRRGFKNLEVGSKFIDVYWDLASAKFGFSPEPVEGFYLAIVVNKDLILMLGDMEKEVKSKIDMSSFTPNFVFVSKKEHVFGKKVYATRAQFCGKGEIHDIVIECDLVGTNDPCLLIRVDGKTMMQVKHLRWKFRGNYTILVDGLPVEVYWDVHNWLFGKLTGEANFLFQTCLSAEKMWASQSNMDASWSNSFRRDPQSHGLGFSLVLCAWKNE